MAGPLPLRQCCFSGGSTQCSPHPAADVRSAATAAGRGSPSPTPPPPPNRLAAGRALINRGEGSQPPGAGSVRELGTQAPYPALRAGASRKPDPYRRPKASPLSQNRSPHHRQPPAGPLHGCWLRLCPRRHRRRQPRGLRPGDP